MEQFGDSGYHASIARSKTFLLIYCYTYINTGLGTSIEPDLNDILAQYYLFTWRSCDVWDVWTDGGRAKTFDDDVVLARGELLADQVNGLRVRQVVVVDLGLQVGGNFRQVAHPEQDLVQFTLPELETFLRLIF